MTTTSNNATASGIFHRVYAEVFETALRYEDTVMLETINNLLLYVHSNIRFYSMSKSDIGALWELIREMNDTAVDILINTTGMFKLRLWECGLSYKELIAILTDAVTVNTGEYNIMDDDSFDEEFKRDEWFNILMDNSWLANLALIKLYNVQPPGLAGRNKK